MALFQKITTQFSTESAVALRYVATTVAQNFEKLEKRKAVFGKNEQTFSKKTNREQLESVLVVRLNIYQGGITKNFGTRFWKDFF